MSGVINVNFGSQADLKRARLADALAEIAENIRANALEYEPHGFVLLLHSDLNPCRFEVLNQGIRTKDDMRSASSAMQRRIDAKEAT